MLQSQSAGSPDVAAAPARAATPGQDRWLLLVHQLPTHPSNLRVRTWRRLQQIGAVAVKQAVYVLPNAHGCREDLEWLKTEIEGLGGEAAVFTAHAVDAWTNDALVNEFLRTREKAYAELAADAEACVRQLDSKRPRRKRPPSARLLQQLRDRLSAIERTDFFGSAGRDRVASLLTQIDDRARGKSAAAATGGASTTAYRGRLWVTRPRPGVDRMASAWLIRRFIDADARFGFAADRQRVPDEAVPFDTYGAEFTHRGELCTFEVLCATFELQEPPLGAIGQIVHDLDLKDGRFGRQEAAAIRLVIDGLQLSKSDDHELLEQGITLFDSLYLALSQADRASRPRPVAKRPAPDSSRTRR